MSCLGKGLCFKRNGETELVSCCPWPSCHCRERPETDKDFTKLGTNPLINASNSTDGRDVDLSVAPISLQGPSCLNSNKLD